MVTLFKNVTNIFTVLGEFLFFGSSTSIGVIASLVLMGTGAFLSALHDLEFSVQGYAWMLLNCLCTSGYILYLRYVSSNQKVKASKMEMVLYNNFLSFAFLSSLLVATGEHTTLHSSKLLHDTFFWQMSILSGLVGGLLSFSTFWCISATSATTYSTVGALTKIPLVIFGIYFSNKALTRDQVLFVVFGVLGGLLFTYIKYTESQKKQGQEKGNWKGKEDGRKRD
jgi:GDP-mannose transporter